jgi:hypothetical protein
MIPYPSSTNALLYFINASPLEVGSRCWGKMNKFESGSMQLSWKFKVPTKMLSLLCSSNKHIINLNTQPPACSPAKET